MKTPKVFTLHDDDFGTEENAVHWAITTSLPDHRLVYRMNAALPINLSRTLEDHVTRLKDTIYEHVAYQYEDQEEDIDWSLIGNKGHSQKTQSALFNDVRQRTILPGSEKVDFILSLTGEPMRMSIDEITKELKAIHGVLLAIPYQPHKSALLALVLNIENHTYE